MNSALNQKFGCYTKPQPLMQTLKILCTHPGLALQTPQNQRTVNLKSFLEAIETLVLEMKPQETLKPGLRIPNQSYGATPNCGCYTKPQLLIQCAITFSDFALKCSKPYLYQNFTKKKMTTHFLK